MNQQTFITKRNEWLEEVADKCHNLAMNPTMKCDLDFYVFQTSCNLYKPDLLIIGINPGGNKSYTSKLEELKKKGETKRSAYSLGYNLCGLEEDINLLAKKPGWEIANGDRGADEMRACFSRVFPEGTPLREMLEGAVGMNRYYFNTAGTAELDRIREEARAFCMQSTLQFIDILNPKNVLFYGREKDLTEKCNVVLTPIENNVKKGDLNNRPVYIIPHYSYDTKKAWSSSNGELMGRTLMTEFNKSL